MAASPLDNSKGYLVVSGSRWSGIHDDGHVSARGRYTTQFPFDANWLHLFYTRYVQPSVYTKRWLHGVATLRRDSSPRTEMKRPCPSSSQCRARRSQSSRTVLRSQPGLPVRIIETRHQAKQTAETFCGILCFLSRRGLQHPYRNRTKASDRL